jgi:hypothetical protein
LGGPQVPFAAELLAAHYHIVISNLPGRRRERQAIADAFGIVLTRDQAVQDIDAVSGVAGNDTQPIGAGTIDTADATGPATTVIPTLLARTLRKTIWDANAHFAVELVGAETANAVAAIRAALLVHASRLAGALANPFNALLEEWCALATGVPAAVSTALHAPTLRSASTDNTLTGFAERLSSGALTTTSAAPVKTADHIVTRRDAGPRLADSIETALPHRAHSALTATTVVATLNIGAVGLALWSTDGDLLFPLRLQQDAGPPRRTFIAARLGADLAI